MLNNVIELIGIGKDYVLNTLDQNLAKNVETKTVLNNINLNIKAGEVVGLIGRNGAGKSTILKLISNIIRPTSGEIHLHGSIGSMIEIGNGFHPELSGRENIYMSGQMMGLSRKYISENINEIINYSGIGGYIDQSVKHYSTGMFVRLAFSMLTVLETDILLFDEILGVGDAEFRIKSTEMLQKIVKSNRTVVLASHNPEEIISICSRVIWIDNANIKMDGIPNEVISEYLLDSYLKGIQKEKATVKNIEIQDVISTSEPLKIIDTNIQAKGKDKHSPIYMEDEIVISIQFQKDNHDKLNEIVIDVYTINGVHVLTDSPFLRYEEFNVEMPKGIYFASCSIPARFLNKGIYYINIQFAKKNCVICNFQRVANFKILFNPIFANSSQFSDIAKFDNSTTSILRPHLKWTIFNERKNRIL
jgi:lipopolysaccharide transport system ATP-binding protein